MENHLCVLLREAKYDPKKMEQLISLFSPLIKKYAGKLFYMDAEDAEQEMKLAFLIAVHSMSYYNSEVECVSYIRNGLYRRFCALCRGNYQNSEEATEVSKLCEYGFTEKYDDVGFCFSVFKAFGKARSGFACSRKNHYAAYGAVKPMNKPEIDLAGFAVLFLDVRFNGRKQILIA